MRALVSFKRGRDTWIDEPVTIKRMKQNFEDVVCDRRIGLTQYNDSDTFRLFYNGCIHYASFRDKFTYFASDPPSYTYNFILQVRPAIKMWLLIANRHGIVRDIKRLVVHLLLESKHDRVWLNTPST